jgi:membrane-associated phospholipid phosphatase
MSYEPTAPGWPPWEHLRRFLVLWCLLSVEFVAVYWGCDWITGHRATRLHLFLDSELSIPLVPAMVFPYMTMYAIFALAPFMLRTDQELRRLATAASQVILISGLCFLLLPAELGFPPAMAPGSVWEPWLRTADRLNLDFNLIPSLHVALFATCAGTYIRNSSTFTRTILFGWLALVTASTVLTHQHHLIDAATGLALGAWGAKGVA